MYVVPDIGHSWLMFSSVLQCCCDVCGVGPLIFQPFSYEIGKKKLIFANQFQLCIL